MNILCFAKDVEDLGYIKSAYNIGDFMVFTFDYVVYRNLCDARIPSKRLDLSYLYEKHYHQVNKKVKQFLKSLQKSEVVIADFRYNQVSLLHLAETDLENYFTSLLVSISVVDSLVKQENPDRILLPPNPKLKSVIYFVASINGVPVITKQSEELKSSRLLFLPDLGLNKTDLKRSFAYNVINKVSGFRSWLRFTSKNPTILINDHFRLLTIIKELHERGFNVILYGNSIMTRAELLKSGIGYKNFKDYQMKDIQKKMSSVKFSLAKKIDNLLSKKDVIEFISYDGTPIDDELLNDVKKHILEYMIADARDIEITESILQSDGLDLAVRAFCGSNDPVATKTNLKSIPSIVIQHGAIGDVGGYTPVITTKIAAWGDICKNQLVNAGVPDEKVVITGNPYFDPIFDKKIDKEYICGRLGLDPRKGILLLTTLGDVETPFVMPHIIAWYNEKLATAVIKVMQEFKDKQLVIKTHPHEDDIIYKQLVADNNCNNVTIIKDLDLYLTKDLDLYSIIGICDLLITRASTTGLEAMLFKKPVIWLILSRLKGAVPYIESNAAFGVYNEKYLKDAIENAIGDSEVQKHMKKFVYDYAYKQDGKASERVVNLIIQMIEESKRKKE